MYKVICGTFIGAHVLYDFADQLSRVDVETQNLNIYIQAFSLNVLHGIAPPTKSSPKSGGPFVKSSVHLLINRDSFINYAARVCLIWRLLVPGSNHIVKPTYGIQLVVCLL